MKFLGYIKRYDSNLKFAESLSSYRGKNRIDREDLENLIKYLKDGSLLWTWMEYWIDDEKESIGGATYYTDGEWVWPFYFIHYLEKYKDLKIADEFIDHVKAREFVCKDLSEQELDVLEGVYYDNLKQNYK